MHWKFDPHRWHRRFALLPIVLSDEVIWLCWYWARPGGEYTEVSLTDPALATPGPKP